MNLLKKFKIKILVFSLNLIKLDFSLVSKIQNFLNSNPIMFFQLSNSKILHAVQDFNAVQEVHAVHEIYAVQEFS